MADQQTAAEVSNLVADVGEHPSDDRMVAIVADLGGERNEQPAAIRRVRRPSR